MRWPSVLQSRPRRQIALLLVGLAPLVGCTAAPHTLPIAALQQRVLAPEEPPAVVDPPALPPGQAPASAASAPPVSEIPSESCPPLTLPEAIQLGFQNNPRLRYARELIEQARAGNEIAFAPFLPTVVGTYRYVIAGSELIGFAGSDIPFIVGFGTNEGVRAFQLAELRLQWTIWDFGRTLGRFEQAALRTDIAQLQHERARQTVAYDVAVAYFRVLQARAAYATAAQAVRNAESLLQVARSLFKRGAVDRNYVLRAEVYWAEVRQSLASARSSELVAVAGLNLAMGVNVNSPTAIAGQSEEPPFDWSLSTCLERAVVDRREITVARKAVNVAEQGLRTVKADFLPRVFIRGVAAQANATGDRSESVQVGGIHLDQNIFEGGRRLGELHEAQAGIRAAIATAQSVCDNIAFEVNQAYRTIEESRQRIELSRTAVAQAEENLRLLTNKYQTGAATPTDVIDAQTTLIRSQQSALTALYDYQTALVRLIYAMGTSWDGNFAALTCG